MYQCSRVESYSYTEGMLPLFSFIYPLLDVEFGQRMIGRVHGWIAENHRQMIFTCSVESLPDRLINSEEYDEDFTDQVAVQVKKHE